MATLLIVVGCVLAPLSVVAVWTRNQVTNTDRYVATVTPLARDPAIQNAITDQITAQVFSYIDVQGLTNQAVDALAERGLTPALATQLRAFAVPIANGVQSFTRTQVAKVVQSDAFADAWVQANRVAHAELVKALTGEGGGSVTVDLDSVPAAVLPHDAAAVLYDTIVRFLRLGLRTVLVLALVVAAGAFLTGPSATAVRTRAGLAGAIGWGAERAGLPTGRVGVRVEAKKRALCIGAVALACLALVFWGRPTGKVVLGLTLALLVVLALIEFLGRRPAQAPVEAPVE